MLFYVILALGSLVLAAVLVASYRFVRLLARAVVNLEHTAASRRKGKEERVLAVSGLSGLDPNTLRPRYRESAALQKPWGW